MKNRNKLSQSLNETSSNIKKLRGCDHEQVGTPILKWFSLQRSQNIPIDGTMIKKKSAVFLLKHLIFQISKSLMVGWISGKEDEEKYTATANKKFIFYVNFLQIFLSAQERESV